MIKAVVFDMFETLITHFESPLYFGAQIAADVGIPEQAFRKVWDRTESDRTLGRQTLEEVLEVILRDNGVHSEGLIERIVEKRTAVKEDCFAHLHPEILPLLRGLREKGMRIGLISNCFYEEASVIRKSVLFPYFDAVCLSCELGLQKPDDAIFQACADALYVRPDECLYIGDGGSQELEAATAAGMRAVQAVWYLRDGTTQPVGRKAGFEQIEAPMDVMRTERLFF